MGAGQGVIDKLLRTIRRPVRERVVVKVVDREAGTHMPPAFLIGTYRSGSTLLRYVLDSHSRIAVPPETNFLSALADLWTSSWHRKGIAGVGVDEEGLRKRLADFISDIFDNYARAKGKSRWVDKTPSYVSLLDFFNAIYGEECRYIMLYRHGLDVAHSLVNAHSADGATGPARHYLHEYPGSPRLASVCYWVEQSKQMMAYEAAHPKQCFRIRYEDYAVDPAKHLPPLFEFLGEPWEPSVMDFMDKPHDYGLQDHKILETNTFVPNVGGYRLWSDDELSRAKEIAAETLAQLGYDV